jgi:hypothetical protein
VACEFGCCYAEDKGCQNCGRQKIFVVAEFAKETVFKSTFDRTAIDTVQAAVTFRTRNSFNRTDIKPSRACFFTSTAINT